MNSFDFIEDSLMNMIHEYWDMCVDDSSTEAKEEFLLH